MKFFQAWWWIGGGRKIDKNWTQSIHFVTDKRDFNFCSMLTLTNVDNVVNAKNKTNELSTSQRASQILWTN